MFCKDIKSTDEIKIALKRSNYRNYRVCKAHGGFCVKVNIKENDLDIIRTLFIDHRIAIIGSISGILNAPISVVIGARKTEKSRIIIEVA